ncbi:hypothetical protein D8674_035846 [Pyrus ussuriensis x Pyrus communis]|uniref:Uncharacterized protein n=1 Tax=Pyrus ussuriensis x Pyrus communis TaxID=2448454 RepID=A0A5N5GJT6_9ROSA|nr:hypothetical protein D8674_035846 [Pyrus ussuriensis x Pyrus communis]
MNVSKAMTVFSLGTLLISAIFVEGEVDAMRIIGYGVTLRDGMPGCSFKHPENCYRQMVNSYRRGCEPEQRCRNGRSQALLDYP